MLLERLERAFRDELGHGASHTVCAVMTLRKVSPANVLFMSNELLLAE